MILCGSLAPIVYLVTVVVGAALRSDYSHVHNAISELIAAGAPNKPLLDAAFCFYNVLVALFGAGLLSELASRRSAPRQASGRWGAGVLVAIGVLGVAWTLFFPMDPIGAPASLPGILHLVLAGLISLGTMAAVFLVGRWLSAEPALRALGRFSYFADAVIFCTGGFTAASAAGAWPTRA